MKTKEFGLDKLKLNFFNTYLILVFLFGVIDLGIIINSLIKGEEFTPLLVVMLVLGLILLAIVGFFVFKKK